MSGVFFTVQSTLRHLNERGSIILNGSVHGVLGIPGYSAYAASKGAVRSMTRVLASELAARGNPSEPGDTRRDAHTDLGALGASGGAHGDA